MERLMLSVIQSGETPEHRASLNAAEYRKSITKIPQQLEDRAMVCYQQRSANDKMKTTELRIALICAYASLRTAFWYLGIVQ